MMGLFQHHILYLQQADLGAALVLVKLHGDHPYVLLRLGDDDVLEGVDPAARDFILSTILTNYNESGTVLISTHLIADVERVLDEAVFLKNGRVVRHESVDSIRETEGKSVDALFREIFKTQPVEGGDWK